MAEFNYKNSKIYYETYGEGKPIVILNGIMMSTNSWQMFVKPFSKENRLILVDFLDQGKSSRMTTPYTQKDQVEVVKALLDELKLEKAYVCGISYGGEVAIQFAAKYPDMVEKLVLSNTTSRTTPWLRDIGDAWNLAAEKKDGALYYFTTIPVIYSCRFYESKLEWMRNREKVLIPFFGTPGVMETFTRLVHSAEDYDARAELCKITAPTLIISCDEDGLTPPLEQKYMNENIVNSEIVVMPKCGHASMYEKPNVWTSIVLGYLNLDEDISI